MVATATAAVVRVSVRCRLGCRRLVVRQDRAVIRGVPVVAFALRERSVSERRSEYSGTHGRRSALRGYVRVSYFSWYDVLPAKGDGMEKTSTKKAVGVFRETETVRQ